MVPIGNLAEQWNILNGYRTEWQKCLSKAENIACPFSSQTKLWTGLPFSPGDPEKKAKNITLYTKETCSNPCYRAQWTTNLGSPHIAAAINYNHSSETVAVYLLLPNSLASVALRRANGILVCPATNKGEWAFSTPSQMPHSIQHKLHQKWKAFCRPPPHSTVVKDN